MCIFRWPWLRLYHEQRLQPWLCLPRQQVFLWAVLCLRCQRLQEKYVEPSQLLQDSNKLTQPNHLISELIAPLWTLNILGYNAKCLSIVQLYFILFWIELFLNIVNHLPVRYIKDTCIEGLKMKICSFF